MKAQVLTVSAATLLLAVGGLAAPLPVGRPKERATLEGHYNLGALAFSPDGKTLASAGRGDGTARLWNVASSQCTAVLKGHAIAPGDSSPFVARVAFSPDGKTLASAGWDGAVKLWDVATGKCTATLQHRGLVLEAIAFSPDGKTLAASYGEVVLWDLQTEKQRTVYKEMKGQATALAFDPRGKLLFAGSDLGPAPRKTFAVWDPDTGKPAFQCELRARTVGCLAFSPDGKTLASGARAAAVQLWDVTTGTNTATFEDRPGSICSLAFSPDSKILACGFGYMDGDADASPLRSAVRVYETATGKVLATLKGIPGPGHPLAFSPDGRLLAAGTRDGKITLWDLPATWKTD